ncbi:hypothetical protein H8R29_11400 [Priestia megaterium]|uniref:Uncharacterized protein n=1 Tax=Priestia megaterium (strain ATCC 14581 / DSM 32 / CCUG 1817 / JCM 2506 / NBRC 15308 / NCIMB 9376 / NCTC 10342 / NRRL B-14308 / VKM B-512 / Ford 19) TaxID=1348623 RepID=A0A0B6AI26_PRIM2|nr:hypothetical protein [Priestia megaterium]AJI20268.1 hypothetical protein BG04_4567 [Priestia megaterium NBRC 15308 = ATCC 14581]KFM98158.1 hypothetical protein DJ91_702 [Priestia megaterium]KGJ73858.1 hypothetical protein BMT_05580 [Priestia megaterium NBRC 15308 = ATCC 14581]MDR4231323.1 hypothetical protein [Priestia megaterium]MED3807589.1 hypothetical protein [Priestia megaterium]
MATVATGSMTLIDVTDAKQLIAFIGSSQQRQVIYNPNGGSYTPNYASSNNVLTPQLYIAGTNTNIADKAKSIKWFYQTNSSGNFTEITASNTNYTLGTTAPKTLTIKGNVLASANSMTYMCEVVYTDPDTGFDVTTKAEYEIIKVTNGTNGSNGAAGQDAVRAVVWTPDGNVTRNSNGTVKATVDVYKGASKVTPTAFKWYIQDPAAITSSGGDADGGAGWRLLTSTSNAGVTGYTTDTITIPASAIPSVEAFKCVATYNNVKYNDVCTVVDVSDPYVVTIVGTNTFKNGQGSTTLTAKVFQAGAEVDAAGTAFTYKWSIYDANNVKNTNWSKTGKSITVTAADINVRGNVTCDIDKA